jgi:hypothetical protein
MSLLIVALGAGLTFSLLTREHETLPTPAPATATNSGNTPAATPGLDGGVAIAPNTSGSKAEQPLATKSGPQLGRPVRVIALGWDRLVPGLIANGGTSSGATSLFAKRGVQTELSIGPTMAHIEDALANGGTHERGADIAIISLPELAASYESLRALAPKIFFVVGRSHGRDALVAAAGQNLTKLPKRGEILLVGDKGAPSTLLGLFALDLAGASPERVRVVPVGDASASSVTFAAIDRTDGDNGGDRRIVLTTADAAGLVPYVAVASEGFLSGNSVTVREWSSAWLEGVEKVRSDVPLAARTVAAIDGAPEPVDLIRQLGQIESATLADNARLLGLSGRGAITIEQLFQRTWKLWRTASVLTTPAPPNAPLYTNAVTGLVLRSKERPRPSATAKPSFDTKPILRITVAIKSDSDEAAVAQLGVVAGVFERSALQAGIARNAKKSAQLIEHASQRYGLDKQRVKAAPKRSKRKSAVIEVLAAP